jgi:phosphatidylserine/phosphatidylglycerophosphate/cardiolipin synthase-like enzyme
LVDSVAAFRRICEAVEAAGHSVWVTVTFVKPDFQMPDGRGTLLEVLERAVERGLDVRGIFWRPNPETVGYGPTFPGSESDHAALRARKSRVNIRWDRAPGSFCQHQKSWLIDAGHATEVSFVGGMNLAVAPEPAGHRGEAGHHDLYVELAGPAATDVHHNFAQRWNEASEREATNGLWGPEAGAPLPFPTRLSAARGGSVVQIQRNLHEGRYSDGHPSPDGEAYDVARGERSILAQFLLAIDAARHSIYIENQAIPILSVAARIEAALQRGVDVVALVPAIPAAHVCAARRDPASKPHFDQLAALGRYENFDLMGIAGWTDQGRRRDIYVHAKIMLVDDSWATIGSCNLHANSLSGNSEMNASFWDPRIVRALRIELLQEHLGQDTTDLDDRAALALYRKVGRANRRKREAGEVDWQGLAFTLDPHAYGA